MMLAGLTSPRPRLALRFFVSFALLSYSTILCSVHSDFAHTVGIALWVAAIATQASIIVQRFGIGRNTPTAPAQTA
jgi:hypothetical protein